MRCGLAANLAAGIVVGKFGTATVTRHEHPRPPRRPPRPPSCRRPVSRSKRVRGCRSLARARAERRLHQRLFRHAASRPRLAAEPGQARRGPSHRGPELRRVRAPPQGPEPADPERCPRQVLSSLLPSTLWCSSTRTRRCTSSPAIQPGRARQRRRLHGRNGRRRGPGPGARWQGGTGRTGAGAQHDRDATPYRGGQEA